MGIYTKKLEKAFKEDEKFFIENSSQLKELFSINNTDENKNTKDYTIHWDLKDDKQYGYPVALIGNLEKAKIIILNLNPGYDNKFKKKYKEDSKYRKLIENSVLQKDGAEFYATAVKGEPLKENYWFKKLEPLLPDSIKALTKDGAKYKESEELYNNKEYMSFMTSMFAIAEFFPYHSTSYGKFDKIYQDDNGSSKDYLPSQKVIFSIIEETIDKNEAIFIISRGLSKWRQAVPKLNDYDKVYVLSNQQNISFKKENILKLPGKYNLLFEELKKFN